MMAVDEKKRILLVRQFRLPAANSLGTAGRAGWIPAKNRSKPRARVEGRDRLPGAQLEEAGVVLAEPRLADEMTIYPGDRSYRGDAQPMEDERIECRWFNARNWMR